MPENDYTFVALCGKVRKWRISYTHSMRLLWSGKTLLPLKNYYDFNNPDEPVKLQEHIKTLTATDDGTYHRAYHQIHTTATNKDSNKRAANRKKSDYNPLIP